MATGDVAINHNHRWREDVDLMRQLGLSADRFGISWSRLQPTGRGAGNAKGLELHNRLIDALVEAGIEPIVTLCHYDVPKTLVERCGWVNRDMTGWFADYAAAEHHLLLAHGRGLQAIHVVDDELKVGLVNCYWPVHPWRDPQATDGLAHNTAPGEALRYITSSAATVTMADEDAAEAARHAHALINRPWLDPLFLGRYPKEIEAGPIPRPVRAGDVALIGTRPDFLGVNSCGRIVVTPARRDDGGNERGYCYWSLLDKLEWDMGWGQRFGLIHVDYDTLKRTNKDSGRCDRDFITRATRIARQVEPGFPVSAVPSPATEAAGSSPATSPSAIARRRA